MVGREQALEFNFLGGLFLASCPPGPVETTDLIQGLPSGTLQVDQSSRRGPNQFSLLLDIADGAKLFS